MTVTRRTLLDWRSMAGGKRGGKPAKGPQETGNGPNEGEDPKRLAPKRTRELTQGTIDTKAKNAASSRTGYGKDGTAADSLRGAASPKLGKGSGTLKIKPLTPSADLSKQMAKVQVTERKTEDSPARKEDIVDPTMIVPLAVPPRSNRDSTVNQGEGSGSTGSPDPTGSVEPTPPSLCIYVLGQDGKIQSLTPSPPSPNALGGYKSRY